MLHNWSGKAGGGERGAPQLANVRAENCRQVDFGMGSSNAGIFCGVPAPVGYSDLALAAQIQNLGVLTVALTSNSQSTNKCKLSKTTKNVNGGNSLLHVKNKANLQQDPRRKLKSEVSNLLYSTEFYRRNNFLQPENLDPSDAY